MARGKPERACHDGRSEGVLIYIKNVERRWVEIGSVPTEPTELVFYISIAVAVISTTAAVWILLRAL